MIWIIAYALMSLLTLFLIRYRIHTEHEPRDRDWGPGSVMGPVFWPLVAPVFLVMVVGEHIDALAQKAAKNKS